MAHHRGAARDLARSHDEYVAGSGHFFKRITSREWTPNSTPSRARSLDERAARRPEPWAELRREANQIRTSCLLSWTSRLDSARPTLRSTCPLACDGPYRSATRQPCRSTLAQALTPPCA